MYKEFFGLEIPPFNLTPDPRFLYLSRRHREALAALIYAVKERKGFAALTGEIGSGKTTLCRSFLRELNEATTNVALILNSFLTDFELLRTINDELGLDSTGETKKDLIDALNAFLLAENEQGKTTILIIDEAQNLAPAVLEQIRLLGNLETETSKLLQIILIGQPELGALLELPELEQLNQRIMVRSHIGPLAKTEIYHYIRHRLHVAGAKINISLTNPALNRIHHFSGGVPRKINLLCDRALLAAYVAGRFQIDARMVAEAERELTSRGIRGRRRSARFTGSVAPLSAAFLLFGFLALSFAGGLFFASNGPPAPTGAALASGGSPTPKPTPAQTPEPIGLALPGDGANPPAEPAATPEPTPTPSTGPWRYDDDGIVHVDDVEYARLASVLTVANHWGCDVNLNLFQQRKKQTLLGLNLLNYLAQSASLQSYSTPLAPRAADGASSGTTTLPEVLALNLPVILSIARPTTGTLAPEIAVLALDNETVTLGDPLRGRLEAALDDLALIAREATVVYRDEDNLASLTPGDASAGVEVLRRFFAARDLWRGAATGVYDETMAEAVRRFQNAEGLPPTGMIDGPTAARIAAERLLYHPVLSQRTLRSARP